ncbi:MAG: hypothetical protein H6797_02120 [Candidatus Nomurabacteria bacterium]|nr:MAG: hypothetical protein H6797_02120 [Candidatus Nomurabacteria bacterium]
MKKIIIRRLGVGSVARFTGVAQAILGFAASFVALFGGISAVLTQQGWNIFERIFGTIGVALFSLVVIPLIAFLFGWLYGAVLSLIANLFLHTSTGIELDVDSEK